MGGTILLTIISAVLWLGAFVWLYQFAKRQQHLQHQLDAMEKEFGQQAE
jgi:hypothetical protein